MVTKQTIVTWHVTPELLRRIADEMETAKVERRIGDSTVVHKVWGREAILEIAIDQQPESP